MFSHEISSRSAIPLVLTLSEQLEKVISTIPKVVYIVYLMFSSLHQLRFTAVCSLRLNCQ